MNIVKWDKPAKVKSTAQWKADGSADGAPPGCYAPNMSDEDNATWKGKIVGSRTGNLQAELRRHCGCAQVVVIVSLKGGYKYKGYEPYDKNNPRHYGRMDTTNYNIHLALNGGAQFTLDDWADMQAAVQEALLVLNRASSKKEAKGKEEVRENVL